METTRTPTSPVSLMKRVPSSFTTWRLLLEKSLSKNSQDPTWATSSTRASLLNNSLFSGKTSFLSIFFQMILWQLKLLLQWTGMLGSINQATFLLTLVWISSLLQSKLFLTLPTLTLRWEEIALLTSPNGLALKVFRSKSL